MKQYRITLEGHVFDVKVLDDPSLEQVRVQVDGEPFTVGVEAVSSGSRAPREEMALDVPAPALPTPAPTGAAQASGTLNAPLPGVIKSIAVRTGQKVARDDALLVIEAMKMDNVIRASCDGAVGVIHVAEGRQVAYGAPLLDLRAEG
jgi:biotin carboxyl carrier protein